MGVDHYENFPVASVLCPPALRPPVAAIYHFARTADDLADEGDALPEHRLADLAAYRRDLQAVLHGQAPSERWRGMFEGLARSIRSHRLPAGPLHQLLDAFERDARNPRYDTRVDLLGYCALSANPVGRLLLHLYGIGDAQALAQSDAICSALQLINFWQDLGVDSSRGRFYVPAEDLAEHGLEIGDLAARHDSPAARALVRGLCDWARTLMLAGAGLPLRLPGRAGWELRLVVQGGLRVLDRIEAMQFATLQQRPHLGAADIPVMLWRAWRMGAAK